MRVFIFITWYTDEPAWTHALEGPHCSLNFVGYFVTKLHRKVFLFIVLMNSWNFWSLLGTSKYVPMYSDICSQKSLPVFGLKLSLFWTPSKLNCCFCSFLSLSRGSKVTLSYFSTVASAFLSANSPNAGREFFEGTDLDCWFRLSSGNIISVLLPYKQPRLLYKG